MAEISPARAAAFRILCRLHEKPDDQTPLPVLLEESGKTLSSRDAALAAEIIYGVLRNEACLFAALRPFLPRPEGLPPRLRIILIMAALELTVPEQRLYPPSESGPHSQDSRPALRPPPPYRQGRSFSVSWFSSLPPLIGHSNDATFQPSGAMLEEIRSQTDTIALSQRSSSPYRNLCASHRRSYSSNSSRSSPPSSVSR